MEFKIKWIQHLKFKVSNIRCFTVIKNKCTNMYFQGIKLICYHRRWRSWKRTWNGIA